MGTRALILWLAAAVACGGSKESSNLRVRVEPHVWTSMDVCSHGELRIYVNTESGATVRVAGVEERVIGNNSPIDLPAEKIGDQTSLKITAELDGKKGENTFTVPKPPKRRGKLAGKPGITGSWRGEATVSYPATGSDAAWTTDFEVEGVVEDTGFLEFTYVGCLIAGGTSDLGTIEVRSPAELIHRVPLDAALAKAGPPDERGRQPLALTLSIDNSDGVRAELKLEGGIDQGSVVTSLLAPTREGKGLAWAPAYEKGKRQAFAQFVAGEPVLHRGSVREVAAVAWSTPVDSRPTSRCGPYSPPGGGSTSYLDRFVSDETVTIREARTGAVIAEKTFPGVVPDCPRTMLEGGGLKMPSVRGGALGPPMLAWIAATLK